MRGTLVYDNSLSPCWTWVCIVGGLDGKGCLTSKGGCLVVVHSINHNYDVFSYTFLSLWLWLWLMLRSTFQSTIYHWFKFSVGEEIEEIFYLLVFKIYVSLKVVVSSTFFPDLGLEALYIVYGI
jgi:hypothetical protein